MADDFAVELAEAVKVALNAASLSRDFTAERVYDLTAELETSEGLRVDTAIRSDEFELENRGYSKNTILTDVAIRERCSCKDSNTAPDGLMLLSQEIKDLFLGKTLETASLKATCNGGGRNPAYYPEHFRKYGQFTGIITLQFFTVRALA